MSETAAEIIGISASLMMAVLLPLFVESSVAEDVIIGLVAFGVGYLLTLDVAHRIRDREREQRLMAKLQEIADLRLGSLPLHRLLEVPEIEDSVRDMIVAAATARSRRMPFLANRTIERIRRERLLTERVSQGTFHVEDRREELRLVRLALEDAQQSLDAVAGLGIDAWKTHELQEYFDLYLDHGDHLEQRRVFLVDRQDMDDPAMQSLLERHTSAGVDTWALDRAVVPTALCRPLVLFDGELLLLHSQQAGEGIEVRFTDDTLRAAEARQDVESLMAIAKRKDPDVVLFHGGGSGDVAPLRPAVDTDATV